MSHEPQNPPNQPPHPQTTPPPNGLSDEELFDLASELTPDFLSTLLAQKSLDDYCRLLLEIEPAKHHRFITSHLEMVERGEIKRLMIFLPPGYGKSTYTTQAFPGWYIGRNPKKSIICASHAKELAEGFSRKVRNWVNSKEYYDIFPISLASDSKSVSRWQILFEDQDITNPDGTHTKKRGAEYYAVGVESSVTGKRADFALIDDPVKGMKEALSDVIKKATYEWYISDLRTRLKPNAPIAIIQTRWAEDDLSGSILPADYDGGSGWYLGRDGKEKWFVINLPVFARENDILGRKVGEVLWPEWYSKESVENEMAVQTMVNGTRHWNSLYMQMPTTDEGGIFKRKAWRKWPSEQPPDCIAIIQSYDTAFGINETNDFTARTTWGIFLAKGKGKDEKIRPSMILLDSLEKRLEYPELKTEVIKSASLYNPDVILIEKKASGQSLIQDLRRTGKLNIRAIKVDGTDKIMRANIASIVLDGGAVWYMDRDWAKHVITQCAKFPGGKHDDIPDTVSQAMLYVRKRWWVELPDDDSGDNHLVDENARSAKSYYGHRAE